MVISDQLFQALMKYRTPYFSLFIQKVSSAVPWNVLRV